MQTIRTFFCSISILFSVTASLSAQSISRYASTVDGIEADAISIYIEDLRKGEVVLDVNGEVPLTPASVTKVVTAATAFQKVDIDESYQTKTMLQGHLSDSVFTGNIIVYATGDPTIESRYFPDYSGLTDSIAMSLLRKGIGVVKGKIIIKRGGYIQENVSDGWTDDDINWPYGTGTNALNYADNRIALTYSKNGEYRLSPETPGVYVRPSSNGGQVSRRRGEAVYGVNYRGRQPLNIELANPLPDSSFVQGLKNSLNRYGISYNECNVKASGKERCLYTHISPSIYQILQSMILRSDNQMAEAMLKYSWPGLSREEAAKKELDLWADLGIDLTDCYIEDGSGLSRNNRLTAYSLADLLVWMLDNEPDFLRFMSLFPKAGNSGTLKSFLKNSPLDNRLYAKTGSLNGVQCYAGYAVDVIGVPTHVVVIMVNGFKGERAKLKSTLEALLIEKLL